MPIFMIISFTVKEEQLESAHKVIRHFISQVHEHEQETLIYESLYEPKSPTHFHHVMKFEDEAAQEMHKNTSYVKEFVAQLYPLLLSEPEYIPLFQLK